MAKTRITKEEIHQILNDLDEAAQVLKDGGYKAGELAIHARIAHYENLLAGMDGGSK